ncbi:MAG: hypothetical protein M3203_05870, partial [Actinomycetota bacterium]|nr:hypothetical protein [Actinomycetota bacterium]
MYLLAAASTVLGILLFADNRSLGGTNRFFDPVMPVVAVSFTAAGAFLTSRRPEIRVGWILLAGA